MTLHVYTVGLDWVVSRLLTQYSESAISMTSGVLLCRLGSGLTKGRPKKE